MIFPSQRKSSPDSFLMISVSRKKDPSKIVRFDPVESFFPGWIETTFLLHVLWISPQDLTWPCRLVNQHQFPYPVYSQSLLYQIELSREPCILGCDLSRWSLSIRRYPRRTLKPDLWPIISSVNHLFAYIIHVRSVFRVWILYDYWVSHFCSGGRERGMFT